MKIKTVLIVLSLFLLVACGGKTTHTPKPKGYIRFDFPPKSYTLYDTLPLPFVFENATNAVVELKRNDARLKWVDIKYPEYNGIIFLSYIPLHNVKDLAGEVDTSYQLLSKHFDFASGVDERMFVNKDDNVYASTFRLTGQNVASTYQFWATDSVRHFLRGSLYIDCVPNNDSLAPVLDYLQKDLDHLLETIRWRK